MTTRTPEYWDGASQVHPLARNAEACEPYIIPAECDVNCRDNSCPYIHNDSWYVPVIDTHSNVTEIGPFHSSIEAEQWRTKHNAGRT